MTKNGDEKERRRRSRRLSFYTRETGNRGFTVSTSPWIPANRRKGHLNAFCGLIFRGLLLALERSVRPNEPREGALRGRSATSLSVLLQGSCFLNIRLYLMHVLQKHYFLSEIILYNYYR